MHPIILLHPPRCHTLVLALLLTACASQRNDGAAVPAAPRAAPISEAAEQLLARLYDISGQKTLSGQHNYIGHRSQHSEAVADISGVYPLVWGSDFGFAGSDNDKDAVYHRQQMIDEVMRQSSEGAVITLMWHACRPIDDEPCGWKESVQADLTEAQWDDLLTPGTAVHERWLAQVDEVAAYLAQLRDAEIPVLWRPYHEMNGGWFWWGKKKGDGGYPALWRQLYDRLAVHHELDNLIWVWNANAPNAAADGYDAYFPGHAYVDVLATDVYGGDYDDAEYEQLVTLANGKPVGLGEIGEVPSPEIFKTQPRWAWFMVWANFYRTQNEPEAVRALFQAPRVVSLAEGL